MNAMMIPARQIAELARLLGAMFMRAIIQENGGQKQSQN
jgi:hypothetical protein